MKFKGIIFDLDGVICSTDEYHYQAWKVMADEIGVPFDRAINNGLRGVSRMESLNIILEKTDVPYSELERQALAVKKNEFYKQLLNHMSVADLSDEVKMTLEQLRERGILLAIGSSSRNAKFILERIGLNGFFDAVSDGTNITRSKPDPEVFLKAAEYLGLKPQECLVVEDAISGVEAAWSGGMKAASVGDAASNNYGDFILNYFSELLTLVQ